MKQEERVSIIDDLGDEIITDTYLGLYGLVKSGDKKIALDTSSKLMNMDTFEVLSADGNLPRILYVVGKKDEKSVVIDNRVTMNVVHSKSQLRKIFLELGERSLKQQGATQEDIQKFKSIFDEALEVLATGQMS